MKVKIVGFLLASVCILFLSFMTSASLYATATTTEVTIENISAAPAEVNTSPIMITNVSEPGVAAATINLIYNSTVVNVISVKNSSFDSIIYNINNSSVFTKIITYQTGTTGLVGDVKLADIELKAVGEEGEVSPLNLEVITLKDNNGVPIPYEVKNGSFVIIGGNHAPIVKNGTVKPDAGYLDTTFTYEVTYSDMDNDPPSFIYVIIDNTSQYNMSVRAGQDEDYTNGEIYEYNTTGAALGIGNHIYRFVASDGISNATGDTGIHEGPCSDEVVTSFNTGSPENPYPSIFGIHNGTIKSSKTIVVSKLYTYPCSGTGGHTEYVRIWIDSWNDSWNVTARWSGYSNSGDWHNITFDESFTLQPDVEYNYTIRTGSYPRIHHTDELKVDSGTIRCTEFIDVNGKSYNNWIPAIKLFP